MLPDELKQLRVLVVGLGVSGASVVRYLGRHGVPFQAVESGPAPDGLPADTQVYTDLDAAVEAGPEVMVLSPGIPRSTPAVVRAQQAGCRIIGDVELFAAAVSAAGTPLVAVTGSNGKSSVVAWLAESMARCDLRAVACGNIGAAALDALDPAVEVYVLELSSYQLESTSLLAPLVATVLNVSEDHLDRYDSFEAYAATKRRVYRGAEHRVINADDALTRPAWAGAAGDALVTLGVPAPSELARREGEVSWHLDDSEGGWLCRDGEQLMPCAALPVPGRHNVFNALAVLALAEPVIDKLRASRAAQTRTELIAALGAWRGLPHRTRLIAEHAGVRWYDDSKGTNVAACVRAIQAMPGPVVLIAGGEGKGADFAPLADCATTLKRAVLIGRDAALLRAVLAPGVDVVDAASMQEAVQLAADCAEAGDAILLSPACASFDMFRNYIARGKAFEQAANDIIAARTDPDLPAANGVLS